VTAINFNGQSIGGLAPALVDTGSFFIDLPPAVFQSFVTASGGVFDGSFVVWNAMPK
jgi:hypothetical protein